MATIKDNKNKKAVKTAQLEENKVFTDYNKNKKEAFDLASKALLAMQNVLTDYYLLQIANYINFSVNNNLAENAPKALMVMQQFDTLCPNRLAGSTPARGAPSAFFNLNNGVIIN